MRSPGARPVLLTLERKGPGKDICRAPQRVPSSAPLRQDISPPMRGSPRDASSGYLQASSCSLSPRCSSLASSIRPTTRRQSPRMTMARNRRHRGLAADRGGAAQGASGAATPDASKKKTPHCHEGNEGFSKRIRQRPTLPRGFPRSTIGSGGLNFRVRDGNGWDPSDIATGKSATVHTKGKFSISGESKVSLRQTKSLPGECLTHSSLGLGLPIPYSP